jgi:phenylpropionate dioxygenase-like ring-hydroxylating dioxygenase large terminal subunit
MRLWSLFFVPLSLAYNIRSFPKINQLWKDKKILPLWLPIEQINRLPSKVPKLIKIYDEPFALYKDNNNNIQAIYDKCPHQGASLSKGLITANNTLFCPYHGFEFNNGTFCRMPTTKYFTSSVCVPRLKILTDKNFIYALPLINMNCNPKNISSIPEPYCAPEYNDENFRTITGQKIIHQNAEIITENVLDMLHISFVHSFGNRVSPIPFNIEFNKTSNLSGKTTFKYYAGPTSISKQAAQENVVLVENEFYLPSTTVTRVIAGKFIKTVVTKTLTLDDNTSILFWELHRNFWTDAFSEIVDILLRFMMGKTLQEDIDIISTIDKDRRFLGINTTFDITINKYRKLKQEYYDTSKTEYS